MAYVKNYAPGGWQTGAGGGTPIAAANLNNLETQYDEAMTEGAATAILPESHLNIWDDFITGTFEDGEVGSLGWRFVANAVAGLTSSANHPGIAFIQTTNIINNRAYLYTQTVPASLLFHTDLWEVTFVIYLNDIANVRLFVGVMLDLSAVATNQHKAGFEFDTGVDGFWMMCTGSGAAETRTATTIAPANAWYKLLIKRVAAGVEFYIDDMVLEGTVILTLPTAAMGYGLSVETLAAANKIELIDLFHLELPGITR